MRAKQYSRSQAGGAELLRIERDKRHDDAVPQHGAKNRGRKNEQWAHARGSWFMTRDSLGVVILQRINTTSYPS